MSCIYKSLPFYLSITKGNLKCHNYNFRNPRTLHARKSVKKACEDELVKEVRLQANDLHALNANDCKNGAGSSQFIVDSSTLLFYKPKNQVVSTELQITGINSKQNLKVIASMIDRVNDSQNPLQSGVVLDNINDNYGTKNKTDIKLVNAIKPRDLDWYEQSISLRQLPKCYMMLSKIKLTGLVVITAVCGYAIAPSPFDPLVFSLASLGTGLLSCAANCVNQYFEVPFDSQMARTKNRILVKRLISPLHAVTFAATCSSLGFGTLLLGVNPLTACLGAVNLILYTSIYTPMKRASIANTWLGSIVGAIPPVMGWTACTGTLDSGALLLGGLLFAWQFPHFNALSWNLRGDYSKAGYRMMSVTNPSLCRRTALQYSVVIVILSTLAPLLEVTSWTFAVDSFPLNAYMVYLSWKFYRNSDSASSRKLFRFSLIHLPALMILMLISKKHYSSSSDKLDESSTVHLNIGKVS